MNIGQRLRFSIFLFFVQVFIFLSTAHISSAQEFSVKALGDYGNVTVMEVAGNYDIKNQDGFMNNGPRQAIAKEFFKTHTDDYDFLVIMTNFDFRMIGVGDTGFYHGIKNDISGIGLSIYNNSLKGEYGSKGNLQGLVELGNLSNIVTDPLNPEFGETMNTLTHEVMHRWTAHTKLRNPDGSDSYALLGMDQNHWSFLLDTYGSVMYGNRWQDNGDGTFTSTTPYKQMKQYSPLDLYLMGMIDKSKVPPMLLIENPSVDAGRLPEAGVTISGSPRTVTIDEIIAANGERYPDLNSSQKSFKTAFVFITAPGTFKGDDVYLIENIRNQWVTRHSVLTDGKSIVEVASTPTVTIQSNPGIVLPVFTPRAVPANIDDGVAWLMSTQNADGSWSDLLQTVERDTAASTLVLKSFSAAQTNYQAGLGWLSNMNPSNLDYLCRRIEALGGNGQDVTLLVEELLGMRNTDGGWGSSRTYRSNAADTALALKALASAGYSNQTIIPNAVQYLKNAQKPDGGWTGNGESTIQATSNALAALVKYRTVYPLEETIAKAIAWLLTKQNSDGGFGNSPSTVYDTAVATLALREFEVNTTITNKALEYLNSQQDQNGSWNQSAYQTALAIAAILKGTVDPDLVVKTSDISFIPERISSLPSNIVISANISNLGRTAVQQAKVALYEGDPALGNKLSEQTLAFPGNSSTSVTFQLEVADGTERRLYLVIDPENLVKESNESNNSALKILSPEATYDFVIQAADITVTPNPVDQYQDVIITAKITNKGTMNAYNVQVKYFIDEQMPFEIATLTVDVPSGETITKTATWRASKAGVNMPLAVQADPFNNFAEVSETNNKASVSLTVNQVILTDPNITISYRDMAITPSSVNQGGNAAISAVVKNEGFSAANDITINFYRGVPGQNGLLLGTRTISSLGVNESATVSIDWTNIQETGEKIIYVEANYSGQEIQKDDNAAFLTLNVLSYPDFVLTADSITVMPALPREGDPTTIYVKVRNQGDQSVSNVPVILSENNIVIGTRTIATLHGKSETVLSFSYDTNGKIGTHTITAAVDKDNAVLELSEDNNSSTKTFAVNDASQWVTEEYFSPNGDGVKDTTEVFFRLATPETVSINVVNEKGENVRTFSGAEFANTTGGSIIWDGLDNSGRVVGDGPFRIQAINSSNTILVERMVVVDNNRSPLKKAFGTNYFSKTNIGCNSGLNPYTFIWKKDESGFFSMNDGGYMYSGTLREISLNEENTRIMQYFGWQYELSLLESSDKSKFAIWAENGRSSATWMGHELFTYDYEGQDTGGFYFGYPYDFSFKWSGDGNKIAELTQWYYWENQIRLEIDNDDGDYYNNLVLTYPYSFTNSKIIFEWSPDSSRLAYFNGYSGKIHVVSANLDDERPEDTGGDDGGGIIIEDPIIRDPNEPAEALIYDISDEYNKQPLYTLTYPVEFFEWADNDHVLIYKTGIGSVLINTRNATNKKISASIPLSLSPKKTKILVKEEPGIWTILSSSGEAVESSKVNSACENCNVHKYFWSPDESRVAWTQGNELFLIDTAKHSVTLLEGIKPSILEWYDDTTLIYVTYLPASTTGVMNAYEIAENKTLFLETFNSAAWTDNGYNGLNFKISPLKTYLSWSAAYYAGQYVCGSKLGKTLLNLSADFNFSSSSAGVTITGTATDENLEGWKLEYSTDKTSWSPIVPFSDRPAVDEALATWVPPSHGTFSVKLTVWDKAGNVTSTSKNVSWGESASVTSFYKTNEIISPTNDDGFKDSTELHYKVVEAVHLNFTIYDSSNRVIVSFEKDYVAPTTDFISWDGTDSNGNIVPDGKYKIKVQNFEFVIEVDNIPPDVQIVMGPIVQTSRPQPYSIYTNLTGHAVDANAKRWIVEYGEGDNPSEWKKFMEGTGQLVKKDPAGIPILEPITDATISSWDWSDIGWLGNKKMRIIAEDFAGNKSSAISDIVEEKIILYGWDLYAYRSFVEQIPAAFARPGYHTVQGFETLRAPISAMFVQAMIRGTWIDAAAFDVKTNGEIIYAWNTANLAQPDFSAVRLKIADSLGEIHFSNPLVTYGAFSLDVKECNHFIKFFNYLLEELSSLKIQVRSINIGELEWTGWTDFAVYDASTGQIPFYDEFVMGTEEAKKYELRMVGVGISGHLYESNTIAYPPLCPLKLLLEVKHQEAGCGMLSPSANLQAKVNGGKPGENISLKTLEYWLKTGNDFQLLKEFDLSREGAGSVAVNTGSLPAGSYHVKAVLEFEKAGISSSLMTIGTLTVDHTLPSGQITHPAENARVCPVKVANTTPDKFELPIDGITSDNTNVDKYKVYFSETGSDNWLSQIERSGAVTGRLGSWDVTDLNGKNYTAKLQVTDVSGNTACLMGPSFTIDTLIDVENFSPDIKIFSPNGDDSLDTAGISYEINESALVAVKVFNVLRSSNGEVYPGTTLIRTIVEGLQHAGGKGQVVWDGKADTGSVPDGTYGLALLATDTCGNTRKKWSFVEVDTLLPNAAISYPRAGEPLPNILEVRGSAEDMHFQSYVLEAGQGENPGSWSVITMMGTPVTNNVLGTWNTSELSGLWTLRLTATDTAGNSRKAKVTIDLGTRQNLIKAFEVLSKLISPNNDGKKEIAQITYETTATCDIKLEVIDSSDTVKRTIASASLPAGSHSYDWNGTDDAGIVVADGAYRLKLTASLSSNTATSQVENVSIVVDSTPPAINIMQPADDSYFKSAVTIIGSISDSSLADYSVSYQGSAGEVVLDNGSQARDNYTFGTLSDLAEGSYTVHITAEDQGETTADKTSTFTVDRTPPVVKLDTPKDEDFYGAGKDTITVSGSIVENNLEFYVVRYGAGENPSQWTELTRGTSIPTSSQLCTWNVGTNSGITEGTYTLSLYAKDKAGSEADVRIKVAVDSQPPVMTISEPGEGQYIKAAIQVKGTASDQNPERYTLEISDGNCSNAFKWLIFKTGNTTVNDGILADWQTMPPDGNYCLKATAYDKMGNKTAATVNVNVDTHPPIPPVLIGKVQNRTNAQLDWSESPGTDVAGYNIYRNFNKVNTAPVTDISFLDQNLTEGTYGYRVKALDIAGWESEYSNEIKVAIDTTAPDARIASPMDASYAGGLVEIKGKAYSAEDFKQYRVSIGQGASPSSWTIIRTSPLSVPNGLLAQWDGSGFSEGAYSIKLEAEDISGNINTHHITMTIDNTPPQRPVIVSATNTASTASVIWNANTESDLAGYLLYRNDQLANAADQGVGDVKPYLLSGTSYLDASLPDGTFTYYVIAMDRAGNMSLQSESREVIVDTHAPHATILAPANNSRFEGSLLIKAESPDLDITSIQFQYKKEQDSSWTNLGSAITTKPYAISLDPSVLGPAFGGYDLRAVATDESGKTDNAPSSITVTYTDVKTPVNLSARTDGNRVNLSWSANGKGYLSGYNVYRTSGGIRSKINSNVLSGAIYEDSNLADGTYVYDVTAVDKSNSETLPTDTISASIYAPVLMQPFAPTAENTAEINGNNAVANSAVEVFVEDNSGTRPGGMAQADSEGKFSLAVTLSPGENRITAKATDAAGNVSRISQAVLVIYNEAPSAPSGLTADVTAHDAHLTWNPNSEADVAGYNLYRKGIKVNQEEAITSGTATASSTNYYLYSASKAFDRNYGTFWLSYYSYEMNTPIWWQVTLAAAELINGIEIQWFYEYYAGQLYSYAGKDFEIQAAMGDSWVTLKKINENSAKNNVIDFNGSFRTDKIRIYITDIDTQSSYKYAGISEVRILKDKLIAGTSYDDLNLPDGKYDYTLTAVDYYGLESVPSEPVHVEVGDVVPPPSPQNFTAVASGSSIILAWIGGDADVAGYNIYRQTGLEWVKITSVPITTTSFTDLRLRNGEYAYRVTAIDIVGNESVPSEARATVAVASPQPPLNLSFAAVSEGHALALTWDHPGGSAVTFNIYRSMTSSGPYVKLNAAQLNNNSYFDTGLLNGTRYYYVATSLDIEGNEGTRSTEVMGTPADSVPPSAPKIFFPTVAPAPVTVHADTVNIVGKAEPGSTVTVSVNNLSMGSSKAREQDNYYSSPLAGIEPGYGTDLSPDGNKLVLSDTSGNIKIQNLTTGSVIDIGHQGSRARWSPDGMKILYETWDGIFIYDTGTASAVPLSGVDPQPEEIKIISERGGTWSPTGEEIAYQFNEYWTTEIWIKNLKSGSARQLTTAGYASDPKWSSTGKYIAYYTFSGLTIVEVASGEIIMTVDNEGRNYSWSADDSKIVYAKDSTSTIWVADMDTQSKRQLTPSGTYEYNPVWSPDGERIIYKSLNNTRTKYFVGSRNIISGETEVLTPDGADKYDMYCTKFGTIAYLEQNALNIIEPSGIFRFDNAKIKRGENMVTATSTDESGNVSSADSITVVFDSSLLPDPEITESDIFIYPEYPLVGKDVAINAVVWNRGGSEVKDVDVDLYLWDSTGNVRVVKTKRIPSIAAGDGAIVNAVWNSGTNPGVNTIITVIDSEDKIQELLESNNTAMKEITVVSNESVVLATSLDAISYSAGQDVNIGVNLKNPGMEKAVTVSTAIEDQSGYPATVFDPKTVTLTYGSNYSYDLAWNTGSTYAGTYTVHTVLKDASGIIDEKLVSFAILPDISISAALATSKANYGTMENVALSSTVKSMGQNYIIPALRTKMTLTDPSGAVVFSEEKDTGKLLPGGSVNVNSTWNTGTSQAGTYMAALEVYREQTLVSTKSAQFNIGAVAIINGDLTATPSAVSFRNGVKADYRLSNSGNSDATELTVQLLVVDPETGDIKTNVRREGVEVRKGEAVAYTAPISTEGLSIKTYKLVLQYSNSATTKTIGTTSFTIKDMLAPVVSIQSPVSGTTYNDVMPISVNVTDDATGVERVEYRIDAGAWKLIPPSDLSSGRYATSWEPTMSDNGPHILDIRARDKAGNTSEPVPVSFEIQLDNVAPVTVITVGEPKYESSGTLAIASATPFTLIATDNFSGVAKTEYQIDDGSWTAYETAFTLASFSSGTHAIRYRSSDNVGNEEVAHELNIVLDKDTPETFITASDQLIENVVNTVTKATFFTLHAADTLSGVRTTAYRIDEGPWQSYTGSFNLAEEDAGQHTVTYKSTDNVFNEEAEKTLIIRLLVIKSVKKSIAADSVVLVGIWSDKSDLEQKQKDLTKLDALLRSLQVTYTIATTTEEFTSALRSGRYNTYILVDVKEPVLSEEVREAVYAGDGLIFLKTRQDADPFLADLFGTKLTGRTTTSDITADLVSSPISNGGALQISGKAIVASLVSDTAQAYAYAPDKRETTPVIIFNQHGRGRAILYTFDLLASPDEVTATALMINSIGQVRPLEKIMTAMVSVPVRITVENSGEPAEMRIVETIPEGTAADTIVPQSDILNGTITWQTRLASNERARFGYVLNLPDRAGDYVPRTEIEYSNNGIFVPYETHDLTVTVSNNSEELLREVISGLTNITMTSTIDAEKVNNAINSLHLVTANASTSKTAEENIKSVLNAADQVQKLTIDVSQIRLMLSELIGIWEKKWYILSTNPL